MYQRRGSRILRNTTATLSVQPYLGGTATAPDSGTVTIVTEGGVTLVNAQAVTIASNEARYDLTPAQTADVNQLIATWTLTVGGEAGQVFVTEAQVVGDLLFNIAAARQWDNGALSNASTYPDSMIIEGRDRVSEAFEEIVGTSLGLAYGRDVLDGNRTHEIILREVLTQSVRSVSVDGQALTDDELTGVFLYQYGRLARSHTRWVWGRQNVVVEYEFGYQPIPLELRQAALRVLVHQIVPSDISDRATSQTFDWGVANLATAGRGPEAWFGIPDADSVLTRYKRLMPL